MSRPSRRTCLGPSERADAIRAVQLGGHPSLAAATIRTGVQDRWQDGEASREWRGETHDGYF